MKGWIGRSAGRFGTWMRSMRESKYWRWWLRPGFFVLWGLWLGFDANTRTGWLCAGWIVGMGFCELILMPAYNRMRGYWDASVKREEKLFKDNMEMAVWIRTITKGDPPESRPRPPVH